MRVYVAGPDVFLPNAVEHLNHLRDKLAAKGITALIPLDNEVTGGFGIDIADEIYKGNVAMIDRCDAVIANIEPFRGDHMDPGTAFEIGYAIAKGKPVYCYTTHAHNTMYGRITSSHEKVLGQYRDLNGMAIEDFGETENLMITSSVRVVTETFDEALAALVIDLSPTPPDDYEEHA